MILAGGTTDCLNPNCDEEVEIEDIENLDVINPTEYAIQIYCKPCVKCEFVTVLEYLCDHDYSIRASEEASNEKNPDRWMAQSHRQTEVFDWTICETCGGEEKHRGPKCTKFCGTWVPDCE